MPKKIRKAIDEDHRKYVPEMIQRDMRAADWFGGKTPEAYAKNRNERATLLGQLELATFWVKQLQRKLPLKLVKELATFQRRFFATSNEGLILNMVNEAAGEGYPVTLAETRKTETRKKSAFDFVADKLGMNPKSVKESYYRIKKANAEGGLPFLANSPKPRKQKMPK